MIALKPVKSSNIASWGYDPATGVLRVEFRNGATYDHHDVGEADATALMQSHSPGSAYHTSIRGKYVTKRLGGE
jgi:hypothetical protein